MDGKWLFSHGIFFSIAKKSFSILFPNKYELFSLRQKFLYGTKNILSGTNLILSRTKIICPGRRMGHKFTKEIWTFKPWQIVTFEPQEFKQSYIARESTIKRVHCTSTSNILILKDSIPSLTIILVQFLKTKHGIN